MPKEADMPAEKWHETIDPYRENVDEGLDELTDEEYAQVEAEVAELLRREAAGERVGH